MTSRRHCACESVNVLACFSTNLIKCGELLGRGISGHNNVVTVYNVVIVSRIQMQEKNI